MSSPLIRQRVYYRPKKFKESRADNQFEITPSSQGRGGPRGGQPCEEGRRIGGEHGIPLLFVPAVSGSKKRSDQIAFSRK